MGLPGKVIHGFKAIRIIAVIAFKYGKALFESPGGYKTFVSIAGGGHNDLDPFPAKRRAWLAFIGF